MSERWTVDLPDMNIAKGRKVSSTPAELERWERVEAAIDAYCAEFYYGGRNALMLQAQVILFAILDDLLTPESLDGKTPMQVFREEWRARYPYVDVKTSLTNGEAYAAFESTMLLMGIKPDEVRS